MPNGRAGGGDERALLLPAPVGLPELPPQRYFSGMVIRKRPWKVVRAFVLVFFVGIPLADWYMGKREREQLLDAQMRVSAEAPLERPIDVQPVSWQKPAEATYDSVVAPSASDTALERRWMDRGFGK